ncbi:type V CRISPR-associated endonuclease Cas1 [Peptostreptococcus equinus]|uniref:CRISPR-associated endonuclease Cas1 n=1 Tax=Peptostreptococcus equinus TaxID=3003601 RepID=A0ABY7JMX9_9FIRM|nr:type V CRISPR-associated endonuclease Cas1 [Peptostreptococcus sp. CBA3647]WAW14524.1 type V CRISPR-associated endonuclease Cas1 [Peptostreptococcus sp. CBA3647]
MIQRTDFEKKQILFVFTNKKEKLSISNQNIIVKDENGKIKHQSTCHRLYLVFIIGHMSITTALIQKAKKYNFTICLMNTSMKMYELIGTKMEGNTLLRKAQYEYNGLDIGKGIISNKIHNQSLALGKIRKKSEKRQKIIEELNNIKDKVIFTANTGQEIMGLEGQASKLYFSQIFEGIEWKRRVPRIKEDYINSTLDIGYTVLFNFIESLLNIYGFDTYYGVLHKEFYMRKSLVCDLMEPFRSLIDYEVRKNINLKKFKKEDFILVNKQYQLKWENSPKYVSALAKPIIENKEEIFLYLQTYYRAFMKRKSIDGFPVYIMR